MVRQQAEVGVDVVSDGEFGKGISWSQYVIERVAGFERRPFNAVTGNPFTKRRRPRTLRRVLRGARCPRSRRDDHRHGRGRADQIHRAGAAPAGHRQFQGGACKKREGGRRLPAGGGAGLGHPRPQERILQERGRPGGGDRRRRCTSNTSRSSTTACWCSSTTRAPPSPMTAWCRPASFKDYRKWVALSGRAQPRDRGHPDRENPLSRLLGKLARSAHHRRADASDIMDLILRVRAGAYRAGDGQSAPRARMAGLAGRQAAERRGADSGRHQPCHQRGRASGTGGASASCGSPSSSAARTSSPAPTAASPSSRSTSASIRRSSGRSSQALAEGARLASKELWGRGKKAAKKPAAKKPAPKKRAAKSAKRKRAAWSVDRTSHADGSHEASDELLGPSR